MLGKNVETLLNELFKEVRATREKYITTEHLLLAIIEASYFEDQLSILELPANSLRTKLKEHIAQNSDKLGDGKIRDTQPTMEFQRVLQRAVFNVQSEVRRETVGTKGLLIALLQEKETFASELLTTFNVTEEQLDKMRGDLEIQARTRTTDHPVIFPAHNMKQLTGKVFEIQLKLDTAIAMINALEEKLDLLLDQKKDDR